MGTVLFMTWDGGGNVNPVVALAELLVERGHSVHVLGTATLESRFTARGLAYTARDPSHEWDSTAMARELVSTCAEVEADAVVVDYMLPGGLCGAEATGLPTGALVHTLYGALLHDGELDPMYMAASVATTNETRGALGLDSIESLGELLRRCERVIVTCPLELDVVTDPLDANVRHVGPAIVRPDPSEQWSPQQTRGRPIVAVSLGTTPMDEIGVLGRVLDGLADDPVTVIATVGDHIDPTSVPAPPNATVSSYVTHSLMLPYVDLMVSHAGLGTVLNSLSHGVPQVCVPLGREQPQNADAVVRVGAGVRVEPDASAETIAAAVRAVLADAATRDAAGTMAARIAELTARSVAVAAIEELLNGGRQP